MSWLDWLEAAAAGPGVLAAKAEHSGAFDGAGAFAKGALEAATPIDELSWLAERAWDIGGGIYRGAHAGWDIGAALGPLFGSVLSSGWFWIVVLGLVLLYLLQPVLRPVVRVAATPVRIYHHGVDIKKRGVRGNVKKAHTEWHRTENAQARHRRALVSHRRSTADKYAGHGDFAVIVHRSPPPPLEPRSITVQASEFKAAERHLKAHLPKTYWQLERRNACPQNERLALFHFRRRQPTRLERHGL